MLAAAVTGEKGSHHHALPLEEDESTDHHGWCFLVVVFFGERILYVCHKVCYVGPRVLQCV